MIQTKRKVTISSTRWRLQSNILNRTSQMSTNRQKSKFIKEKKGVSIIPKRVS